MCHSLEENLSARSDLASARRKIEDQEESMRALLVRAGALAKHNRDLRLVLKRYFVDCKTAAEKGGADRAMPVKIVRSVGLMVNLVGS